jgi:hypothetical protein
MYHPMVRASYIPAWTALIRRDVAGSRLRFPEDLPTYEDYECLSRLAKFGTAAYLDCATAVNHGHAGPRLTGVNHLAKATSRIAILERIWGSDEEYLRCHREEYEAVLAAQRLVRVKELVLRGQTRTARRELRGLAGVPLSVRTVAALPEGLARLFLGACGRRVR